MPKIIKHIKLDNVAEGKRKPRNRGYHSDEKKIEAIKEYLRTGSPTQVEKKTGVPMHTLHKWRIQPWWKEAARQIATENHLVVKDRLQKLYGGSLDNLEDAIQNGNAQYDQKKGEIVRVPISARDSSRIATELAKQQQDIDKQVERINMNVIEETPHDMIRRLAEEFAKLAKPVKKIDESNIIDVEVVEKD